MPSSPLTTTEIAQLIYLSTSFIVPQYYSDAVFFSTIIISFVRAFHTKCFLIFPCKVSASGILKGSRYTLSLRFFQKVLGQVCLIPKSFKP